MCRWLACAIGCVLVTLLLSACKGGSTLDSTKIAPPLDSGQDSLLASLPALSELPLPEHQASLAGPAWVDFYPFEPRFRISSMGGTWQPDASMLLVGEGGTGNALYGIHHFYEGSFPTSLRVELNEITGSYWVAFSDYHNGMWHHTGPWTNTATIELP